MCAAEWPLFTGHFLRKRKNISTSAKGIEAVAPPLRHLHALLPLLPAMVRRPHLVGISVGQCALYGIGRPFARLVEQGRGHRPEAMRRHLVGSRSEEHTSELQSLMRISYAVSCLKQNKNTPKP